LAASKKLGMVPVLRRLNLIASIHSKSKSKATQKKMKKDINFLSGTLASYKEDGFGGDQPQEESPAEIITFRGKEVKLIQLSTKHVDDVYESDKQFMDSDITKETVMKKLENPDFSFIGIYMDNRLQGYCQYRIDLNDPKAIKIIWFTAAPGSGLGKVLFEYVRELFLSSGNFKKIILYVSLGDKYSLARINFWFKMGLKANKILENKDIRMVYEEEKDAKSD